MDAQSSWELFERTGCPVFYLCYRSGLRPGEEGSE